MDLEGNNDMINEGNASDVIREFDIKNRKGEHLIVRTGKDRIWSKEEQEKTEFNQKNRKG